jgi:catecholate siderophore receptor
MTVSDSAIEESEVKVEQTASPKYTAPLLDTPQTITVISSKSIQQQNLLTLREVLQTVPGVTFGAGEGGFGYGDNWTISANYMYLDSEVRRGVSDFCLANPGATNCGNSAAFPDPSAGSQLQNTPKHSGSVFTTYRFDFGLELGYGINHQGKFLLNFPTVGERTAGTYTPYFVPSYTIHRLLVSYPVTDRLFAQLNVQNFTNEKYVTTVRNALGGSWAQPGTTRQAVLTLNYTF